MSEISKMNQLIEPPKVSSTAELGNKLEIVDSLKDQITAPEQKIRNAGNKWEESGARENKLKEKGNGAVGDTIEADCKAGSFKRESSVDVLGHGMSISKLTDIYPGKEKFENLASTKPTRGTRQCSNKDKRSSPPKKRNYKVPILTGQHPNDKLSDNTGELNDDHKELLAAARSVCTANKKACSGPFWKEMERIFAPVTPQDLLFLKQLLEHAEELNQIQSHIHGDSCDMLGVYMKRREFSDLDQRLVKPMALGRPDTVNMFNVAPSLFQRVLSAMIDEDEVKDLCSQNDGSSLFFKCMSDGSHFASCSNINCDHSNMHRVECGVEKDIDLQIRKCFPVDRSSCDTSASSNRNSKQNILNTFGNHKQGQAYDGLPHSNAGFYYGNDQKDLNLVHQSQVSSQFNYQYQILSLDDKLLLELQGVALSPERMSRLYDGEECIDREIKTLQVKLYQQVAKVKSCLRKIEKAIQCEQKLEKRNCEEHAMDQLVEMAYKRMHGRPSKSSRIRKISKQDVVAFVKRTLSRCKQFEDSGSSCFSQPTLQDIIFYKPLSERDVPTDSNCLTIVNKEVPKKSKRQGSGAIQRLSQSDNLHRGSSGLQQPLTLSSELLSGRGFTLNKWKKELLLHQIVSSTSSEATEVIRIPNPGQMHRGFSGAEQSLSRPSELFSRYDFTFTKAKSKVFGDIGSCSSKEESTIRPGGVMRGETGMENRVQKDELRRKSVSGIVNKSKSKTKRKRLFEEVAPSVQLLELKSSDPKATAGNKQFPSLADDSQDASRDAKSMNTAQLDALDPPTTDVFSDVLDVPEDLCSLLDFDEGVLLDHESGGLDVPMDDLSDVIV